MNRHAHDPYHSLPWLELMSVHVAGYKDSIESGDRRLADRNLRHAIVRRLQDMRGRLDEAVRQCHKREAHSQIPALERVMAHLERVIGRIEASDARIESSYDEARVGPEQADFLHMAHLAIFEQAEALVRHFEAPDVDHDRLPHLEADLSELERKIDARAAMYQKLY